MADLRGKNVLVTGGAGFIGSHLCDCLLLEPIKKVVAVDNLYLGNEANLSESKSFSNFYFHKTDITYLGAVKQLIDDYCIDVIFHLAVIPLEASLENPVWCFDRNVKMTQNLLEVIRTDKRQISLIAYSSSEVYGSAFYTPMDENHPLLGHTPYAASKAASDLLVYSYAKTFGIDFTIVRPFNNYGPRQNEKHYAAIIPVTIKRIFNKEKPIIFSDGKQTRDLIYVKDTVYWTLEIFKNDNTRGKIINLASGRQISVERIINKICEELEYHGPIEYMQPRPGDVRVHEGDIKLAKKLISFYEITPFNQGIISTICWYKNSITEN